MRIEVESCDREVVVTVEGSKALDRSDLEALLGDRWTQLGLLPGQFPSHYQPLSDKEVRRERWTFPKGGY